MNSKENQETKAASQYKFKFLTENYTSIINLEKDLRFALSEDEIKKDPFLVLKVCEGGWLPFKDVFKLQKIFKEEKSFFQALSFVKRIEICQNIKGSELNQKNDQNSTESLMIKLNENFGKPMITFYLKDKPNEKGDKQVNSGQKIKDVIYESIFKKDINVFEIKNSNDD